MKTKIQAVAKLVAVVGAALTIASAASAAPPRPQGPCDIYNAASTPCVAAHSTTRALYASYRGPLYQVKRQTDGKTLDIGVVQPVDSPTPDPGGYADARAHDAFCANAACVINLIYDQSGKGNHLYQAPPGPSFPGPSKGAFDTQPIADMAPVTVSGHKVYGVYIMPGMGFRNNDASGIAINDDPEGIYYVVDGKHYDSGCCFDYGNSSTNGRAVGTGTMETIYFGTSTGWGNGSGSGPWIMSDMEAGLFSGYNAKQNVADPAIDSWRFVTAVVDGGGGNRWDLRGGNAQKGSLTTFYSGARPGSNSNSSYYPMHKQGGILLGTGGDNGNGSSGTFYEGVMTTGYPTEPTTDAVQANIVAAGYNVQPVSVSRLITFTPRSTQEVTATFTNTTPTPAGGLKLSISAPPGWTVLASGGTGPSAAFADPVAPGGGVTATFKVTSAARTGAGLLTVRAVWTGAPNRGMQSEAATERVRNVVPIKVNEVRLNTSTNSTNQFIELYNASASAVDISNWRLVNTQTQWAPVRLATIPSGTKLASGAYYLLGLSSSGLAAPASAGAATIEVRNTTGFVPGQKIDLAGETRTIVSVGTPAAAMTTLFEQVSTGPWIKIPAGSSNLPVANASGFEVGQKIGIDIGGNFELAKVTAVGKAATQTTLSAVAMAGATNIKVAANSNILSGDTLTVGTGERKELVKVISAGTVGASGTGISLAAPLRFEHASGIDVSDPGTGITFTPSTKFPHISGDAVQALGSGITLDRPLVRAHEYGAAVVNSSATAVGYQGPPAPNQWFGGTLSTRAGSIALLDGTGAVIVDALVYGSQQSNSSANGTITSPEIANLEGNQHQGGCIVVVPSASAGAGRSVGRFPDGADMDANCTDFRTQPAATLLAAAGAGASNIKVDSIAGLVAGQTITVGSPGASPETAVIATVGTPGATTVGSATAVGTTLIPVAGVNGFSAGQTVTIGAPAEDRVIASMTRGRGGASITVSAPMTYAHSAGAQISGSGIDLKAPLNLAHAVGSQLATDVPTPGAPNKY